MAVHFSRLNESLHFDCIYLMSNIGMSFMEHAE